MTEGRTDGLTWVGARDTCVSKKKHLYREYPPKMGQNEEKNQREKHPKEEPDFFKVLKVET